MELQLFFFPSRLESSFAFKNSLAVICAVLALFYHSKQSIAWRRWLTIKVERGYEESHTQMRIWKKTTGNERVMRWELFCGFYLQLDRLCGMKKFLRSDARSTLIFVCDLCPSELLHTTLVTFEWLWAESLMGSVKSAKQWKEVLVIMGIWIWFHMLILTVVLA